MAINLSSGVRAQRKSLITVAEWTGDSHDVYTLLTSQPASFDPTQYYKKSGDTWVAGQSGDAWATNTWYSKTTTTTYREIMGVRTEDSSIELNPDVQTSTDILGITYTDVNKTEPQQDFDPLYIIGGSNLTDYLTTAMLGNDIDKYNCVFTMYIITAFISGTTAGTYKAIKHTGCSIIPTSIGGDSYVSLPVEVHFSNNITKGTVDKLSDDFVFTADT